jgi:S1-C subfamily serine protease
MEVALGGASDVAGLRAGDGIAAINGRPVSTFEQVVFVLKNTPRGQPIRLSLRASDGVMREVQISEAQPSS